MSKNHHFFVFLKFGTVKPALAVTVGTMINLRLKRVYGLSGWLLLWLFSPFQANIKKSGKSFFIFGRNLLSLPGELVYLLPFLYIPVFALPHGPPRELRSTRIFPGRPLILRIFTTYVLSKCCPNFVTA